MVWKPPKKKLSLEKMMALAKSLSTPLWFRSKPLIRASIEDEDNPVVVVRILDPTFLEKRWLICTFDPMAQDSDVISQQVRLLNSRYSFVGFEFLLIVPLAPKTEEIPPNVVTWLEQNHWHTVAVGDPASHLAKTLGLSTAKVGVMVLDAGKPALGWGFGKESFFSFELKLQKWLRERDPGLPLHDPDESSFKF